MLSGANMVILIKGEATSKHKGEDQGIEEGWEYCKAAQK